MKGKIRIGGAIGLGVLIVLVAFYVTSQTKAPVPAQGVTVATERLSLEEVDSNGNGIPDWKETLGEKAFKTIDTPTSTVVASAHTAYTAPTTLTGKFSEAFLQDYLDAKMRGEDFSNPTEFVQSAVQAIDASTQSKKHTRAEITIVPTTFESLRAYGNSVGGIFRTYFEGRVSTEAMILERALDADDETILKEIVPIQKAYTAAIADTMRIDVPDILSTNHIALLNTYESLLANTVAFQLAFEDPLYALSRLSNYAQDTSIILDTLKEIANTFDDNKVTYANDEPGAFFYIFDAI